MPILTPAPIPVSPFEPIRGEFDPMENWSLDYEVPGIVTLHTFCHYGTTFIGFINNGEEAIQVSSVDPLGVGGGQGTLPPGGHFLFTTQWSRGSYRISVGPIRDDSFGGWLWFDVPIGCTPSAPTVRSTVQEGMPCAIKYAYEAGEGVVVTEFDEEKCFWDTVKVCTIQGCFWVPSQLAPERDPMGWEPKLPFRGYFD